MDVREFHGFEDDGHGRCRFVLGPEVMSVWGGVHGGSVAAAALLAARPLAPDRVPASLDVRFLGAFPGGPADGEARLLRQGRTQSTVDTRISDGDGRLVAIALATFVDPSSLADEGGQEVLREPVPTGDVADTDEALKVGIVNTVKNTDSWIAEDGWLHVPQFTPWSPYRSTGPEMACTAADLAQGAAAWAAVRGRWATPNADLALRFTTAELGHRVDAYAKLAAKSSGFLAIQTIIFSEGRLVAATLSTCLTLDMARALP